MQDDYPIGLDLGTTNSCIGVYRNGGVEIIPNRIGEKTTPSIVTILDDKILVGEETMEYLVKNYDSSIQEIKRFIGKRFDDVDVQEDMKFLNYNIVKENDLPKVHVGKTSFGPEEISSFIIKKMIQNAETYLNKKVRKLVITVPAYFNNSQRNLTKQAAQLLGLEVLRIINEPTAAALCYGLDKSLSSETSLATPKKVLVFDLGGGTFDVSLLYLTKVNNETQFEVKSTSGDTHLGGEDFDNKLADHFLSNFCNQMKEDEKEIRANKQVMLKLKILSENIKRILSKATETTLCSENFYNKKDIFQKITRKEFEDISQDLFDKLEEPIKKVLTISNLNNSDISEVILIGGSSRIPKVKEILKKLFPSSKINDAINPDEAVAYGATLDAAKILIKEDTFVSGYNLFDIIPLSLGTDIANLSEVKEVKDEGEIMSVLIKRGNRIPIEATKEYCTCADNQKSIRVDVYEGEKYYVKYNHFLGKRIITNLPPRPKGQVTVIVKYQVDVNGILTVTATEKGNKTNQVSIQIINDKDISLSQKEIDEIKQKNQKYYDKLSQVDKPKFDYMNLKKTLKEMNESYIKADDEEDKYNILMNYNNTLEAFIDSFDTKNFDETIAEKFYLYIKELFKSYAKTLKITDFLEKEDKENMIKRIKDYLQLFKKQSLGYLNELVELMKDIKKELFFDIIIFLMEVMNECGDECLAAMKKFCKYHSIIFFEHSLYYFEKYITDVSKLAKIKGGNKLMEKCKEQIKISCDRLNDINNNAITILRAAQLPDNLVEYKGTFSGFSNSIRNLIIQGNIGNIGIGNLLEKDKEKYEIILGNYEKILREIQMEEKRELTEQEAICIANIIKINFRLGHKNYTRYLRLADECERIASGISTIKEKNWYREFLDIWKEIKKSEEAHKIEVKKLIDECMEKNKDVFDKIEQNFKKSNKIEFIDYILKNHPYKGYEEDKKSKKINFNKCSQELLNYLSKKYQPDNYESGDPEKRLQFAIISFICAKINNLYSNN